MHLEYGVFAKKTIYKYTQFGPLEGVYRKQNFKVEDSSLELFVVVANGQCIKLDTSDESKCFFTIPYFIYEPVLIIITVKRNISFPLYIGLLVIVCFLI